MPPADAPQHLPAPRPWPGRCPHPAAGGRLPAPTPRAPALPQPGEPGCFPVRLLPFALIPGTAGTVTAGLLSLQEPGASLCLQTPQRHQPRGSPGLPPSPFSFPTRAGALHPAELSCQVCTGLGMRARGGGKQRGSKGHAAGLSDGGEEAAGVLPAGFCLLLQPCRCLLALLGWVRAQGSRIWEDKLHCLLFGADAGFSTQELCGMYTVCVRGLGFSPVLWERIDCTQHVGVAF